MGRIKALADAVQGSAAHTKPAGRSTVDTSSRRPLDKDGDASRHDHGERGLAALLCAAEWNVELGNPMLVLLSKEARPATTKPLGKSESLEKSLPKSKGGDKGTRKHSPSRRDAKPSATRAVDLWTGNVQACGAEVWGAGRSVVVLRCDRGVSMRTGGRGDEADPKRSEPKGQPGGSLSDTAPVGLRCQIRCEQDALDMPLTFPLRRTSYNPTIPRDNFGRDESHEACGCSCSVLTLITFNPNSHSDPSSDPSPNVPLCSAYFPIL